MPANATFIRGNDGQSIIIADRQTSDRQSHATTWINQHGEYTRTDFDPHTVTIIHLEDGTILPCLDAYPDDDKEGNVRLVDDTRIHIQPSGIIRLDPPTQPDYDRTLEW